MSDTNTGTSNGASKNTRDFRIGGLTLRILSVNVVAPLVLVIGLLYMGQYRDNLIRAELEIMKVQAQLFAGAIAEGAVRPVERGRPFLFARPEEIETLVPELSRRMVRRLGKTTDSRTRLFDVTGRMIGDSHKLIGPGGVVQIVPLDPPGENINLASVLRYLGQKALAWLPMKSHLKPYPQTSSQDAADYPNGSAALQGVVSATAWESENGNIILSAGAPVQKIKQIMGVVLLTKDGKSIETAMAQVRFDVLTVFLGALSITIFMSLYLAGVIGRPLRKLARAAESIRLGQGRHTDIPDMRHRRDEIGELSMALRDMTQALWDRMDTIERFAADVSHEIKNPLTSLRSAVETVSKVKDPKDRDKLMGIIQHDVQRLDRLISDISNASRLDAELSRDEIGEVDLRVLLQQLVALHERHGVEDSEPVLTLEIPQKKTISVRGNESRLAQVFENLISNALSFSPPGHPVFIRVVPDKNNVKISVEDEGPGIPENKLDTIFERFYTERPRHEGYGDHSGLGLSIARLIIETHGGKIHAENLTDKNGTVTGACFTVILDTP